ncbi:MAG: restriction endonuclease subunit S [Bacteroidales bacterium]
MLNDFYAWEQRKLGELANFGKGRGYSKSDLQNSGYPIILYGRLYTKYETVISKVDTFVKNKDNAVISVGNEVIVPASGESAKDISRASVVSAPDIVLGGDLNIIYPSNKIDSIFLALSISNGQQQKEMIKRAQGKSIVHLHNSDLKEVALKYPCIEEQTKIGEFFRIIDTTIALHQRKLELLKQLKKAYLQQMFPIKETLVPNVRFTDYEENWKKHKLKDYLSVPEKMKANIKSKEELMTVKLNLGGIISGANRDTLELGSTIYYKRKAGQFIYGKQNFFNGSIAIIPKIMDGKATSGDVPSLDINNINTTYFYYFISRKNYWKKKETEATGTGSKRIHEHTLLNFDINVPLCEKEQKEIGLFFKQMDKLLFIHQKQIENLETMKKAYLSKLFV